MTGFSDFTAMLAERGSVVIYRRQRDNTCPACGGSNWIVGRTSAECAFCLAEGKSLALPLAEPVCPDRPLSLTPERK